MNYAQLYRGSRERLVELANDLPLEQQRVTTPACPQWSVFDTYAHLAGAAVDVSAGKVEEAGSPRWTQRQVEQRRDHDLSDVCREWNEHADTLEKVLAAAPDSPLSRLVIDIWHHEQDIRAAVSRPGGRDDADVGTVLAVTIANHQRRWPASMPALRVRAYDLDVDTQFGDGEPKATLTAPGYELARSLLSRRSRKQMLAMEWSGDAETFLPALAIFDLPETDQIE